MVSPSVIQVRKVLRVVIASTMTKGHGERPHLGQSFMGKVLLASGYVLTSFN